MDNPKIQYFEKIDHPEQQEFIVTQSHCVLCGSELELKHIADSAAGQIKEEAYCSECEVRTRAKIFSLN
jgi:hypothetical protein